MHWEVPLETMRRLVPAELELDLWEGKVYVGLVPFAMLKVRPSWSPATLSFDFLETNVRTYVTYRGRPGVYFFSLEAASRIAVAVARAIWKLPYYHANMHFLQREETVSYYSQRTHVGTSSSVRCQLGTALGTSELGTPEFFFLERYLLFVPSRNGILTGQVHHKPYPVRLASVLKLEDQLVCAAGFDISTAAGLAPPAFTHFSSGVDVEIFPLCI